MTEKMPINKSNQSFVVEVKCQENHTWQGTIHWVEGQKKEKFRSALEMIRLMDSVLSETVMDKEEIQV